MSAPFSELSTAGRTLVPLAVLTASLVGSVHCAAMCGPLVMAVSTGGRRGVVLYHLGRLTGYAALGALFGFLGSRILGSTAFRLLPLVSGLAIGALLLGLGVRQLGGLPLHAKLPGGLAKLYARAWQKALAAGRGGTGGALVGLLSVFLPCGWLYSFLIAATATEDARLGALALVVFWAGTLPALLVGPLVIQRLVQPLRSFAPRLSGWLLIAAGLVTLGLRTYPVLKPRPAPTATPPALSCPMHDHS